MGWKTVKEKYAIEHIVGVHGEKICIGSSYVYNLIEISFTGEVIKRYDGANKQLRELQHEFDCNPKRLKEVVLAQDTFSKSLPVYTFKNGIVIEKLCEEYGFPNCTHDGETMYSNVFFVDRAKASREAIEDAEYAINEYERLLKEAEEKTLQWRERLKALRENVRLTKEQLHDNMS